MYNWECPHCEGKRADNGKPVQGGYFKVGNSEYIILEDKARVLPLGYTDGPPCLEGFIRIVSGSAAPTKKGKGGTIGGDRDSVSKRKEKEKKEIKYCFKCRTKLRRIKTMAKPDRHYYCPVCKEEGVKCE